MFSWISISVSIVALVIAIVTWYKVYQRRKYKEADTLLADIVNLSLEHPKFRDANYCQEAVTHEDIDTRLKYDAYATIVWNYLETLYDIYGERGLRKSPFYGAMISLGQLHKTWLFHEDKMSYYNKNLVPFLRVEH